MSSWPWMKGIDVAIAAPIEQVNENDDRKSVLDLISKHKEKIHEIRLQIESDPLYDAGKHDDLWILRFVLSAKKKSASQIAEVARNALNFRAQHNLDARDIRDQTPQDCEELKKYMSYCKRGREDGIKYIVPDKRLGVIGYICPAKMDLNGLADNLEPSEWLPACLYQAEWTHQWLDYVTRTTGLLTKTLRFLDFGGVSMKDVSIEGARLNGSTAKIFEDFYPQLLEKFVVCNYPSWIKLPWKLIRPFFAKRMIEKFDFLDPVKNTKDRKFLSKYVREDYLLAFLVHPPASTYNEELQ